MNRTKQTTTSDLRTTKDPIPFIAQTYRDDGAAWTQKGQLWEVSTLTAPNQAICCHFPCKDEAWNELFTSRCDAIRCTIFWPHMSHINSKRRWTRKAPLPHFVLRRGEAHKKQVKERAVEREEGSLERNEPHARTSGSQRIHTCLPQDGLSTSPSIS